MDKEDIIIGSAAVAVIAAYAYRVLKDACKPPKDEFSPGDYAAAAYMDGDPRYDYHIEEHF